MRYLVGTTYLVKTALPSKDLPSVIISSIETGVAWLWKRHEPINQSIVPQYLHLHMLGSSRMLELFPFSFLGLSHLLENINIEPATMKEVSEVQIDLGRDVYSRHNINSGTTTCKYGT